MGDSEWTAADVLDHFGVSIPQGVGAAASTGVATSTLFRVAHLVEVSDRRVGTIEIEFVVPHGDRDGILVRVQDDDNTDYWALPEDVTNTALTRLVKETNFVIKEIDDEYTTPYFSDSSMDESAKPSSVDADDLASAKTHELDDGTCGLDKVESPFDVTD